MKLSLHIFLTILLLLFVNLRFNLEKIVFNCSNNCDSNYYYECDNIFIKRLSHNRYIIPDYECITADNKESIDTINITNNINFRNKNRIKEWSKKKNKYCYEHPHEFYCYEYDN